MRSLQNIRKKRNLSQIQLGEMCGISQVTISLLERGKHSPNSKTRQRIQSALGCDVDWTATQLQNQSLRPDLCELGLVRASIDMFLNTGDRTQVKTRFRQVRRFVSDYEKVVLMEEGN